jgi:uncharacterized protein (DUF1919 family)
MKKIILLILLAPITLWGALLSPILIWKYNNTDFKEDLQNLITPNADLYEETDDFVESFTVGGVYSYGIFGPLHYEKFTSNGNYKIAPVGRLVNVRIEKEHDQSDYEDLAKKLRDRYKNNPNVKDVYISNGGTLIIDCRR